MKVIFENYNGTERYYTEVNNWDNEVNVNGELIQGLVVRGINNVYVENENDKKIVQDIINSNTGYLNHCGVFVDKTKFTTGGSKIKRRRSKRRGSKKRRTTKRRR